MYFWILKKAFDSVPHSLLLHKLSFLGLHHDVVQWITGYLHNRTQCVLINGCKSGAVNVSSGVPQGSVLGPLLFLVYINDIVSNLSCKVRLYADDCVVYRSIKSPLDMDYLQSDLDHIQTWCAKWKMTLNIAKCKHVSFTRSRSPVLSKYTLGSTHLDTVLDYKYLGVYFSSNLTWKRQIEHVSFSASRMLNFLKRNFSDAPPKVKELLYFTNVRSITEYACAVWDPQFENLCTLLERVQNRAARFVTKNYSFRTSITLLKSELGWETLSKRRLHHKLELLYRIYFNKTGLDPKIFLLTPHFVSKRRDHEWKIREIDCRTDVYKGSFFPHSIEAWNKLPGNIVNCTSDALFHTFLSHM